MFTVPYLVAVYATCDKVLALHLFSSPRSGCVCRALGCRMTEQQARALVLRPLLEAVSHLHTLGCVHRDIKVRRGARPQTQPHWQHTAQNRAAPCLLSSPLRLRPLHGCTALSHRPLLSPSASTCPLTPSASCCCPPPSSC